MAGLGWWTISGEELLTILRRAAAGEPPDLLYAEAYAAHHPTKLNYYGEPVHLDVGDE